MLEVIGYNLRNADLRNADLEGADLRWTILVGSKTNDLKFHEKYPETKFVKN